MVVVLYVVALAMVGAGAAGVYDGYDIIVMEKGSAKVVAGTIAVSAGFVLLGIAVAVSELRRIRIGLAGWRERATSSDAPPVAGGPTLGVPAAVEPGEAAQAPSQDRAAAKPPPEGALGLKAKPAAPADPDAPAAPSAHPAAQEADRTPAQTERPAEPAKAAAPPTVIGTYSSGGNTYVMHADGSIQAETPTGLYRFNSIDELKAFIAAGGEAVPPAR